MFGQTAAMGQSATHYRVDATPIDGLKVGADYVDYGRVQGATAQGPGQVHITLHTLLDQQQLVTQKVSQRQH